MCWTSRSVRSAWVRDEAGEGRDGGRLVPVTLDGCQPPLGFRQYQTIDLSGWSGRPGSHALDPLRAAIVQTANGKRQEKGAAPATASLPRRYGSWRWTAGGAAIVVLAASAVLFSRMSAGSGKIDPKVAVGQFGLASADIPRGLPNLVGQEIVAAFGAENAVTVVSPGDRNAGKSPFVMDGNISRIGSSVRVTVNLKNQRSGVVLWSHGYEHEAADAVAARQAAVGASQVVRCGLWGASSYQKRMLDQALSLYLKWCSEHWSGSTSEAAELDAARRVTVAVPDFSFGWSALALATVPLAATQSTEARQLRQEGTNAAHKSMQLDSQNPEGYMALAGLLPLNRYVEREALLKKALSVRPTECGCERQAYGDFLASVGRMGEATEQYERARDMRPLAPFSNLRFAQALYMVGRNEEADGVLHSTLQLWPDATSLRLLKIKSALWTRRYNEAIAEYARALARREPTPGAGHHFHPKPRRDAEAGPAAARLRRASRPSSGSRRLRQRHRRILPHRWSVRRRPRSARRLKRSSAVATLEVMERTPHAAWDDAIASRVKRFPSPEGAARSSRTSTRQ